MLDFVKAEYATLFIQTAKSKDEYSRIEEQMKTTQVSRDSRRSSTVVLLQSD